MATQAQRRKDKKKWVTIGTSPLASTISTFWSLNEQRIFALQKPTAAEDNTQCNCTKVSRCSHSARRSTLGCMAVSFHKPKTICRANGRMAKNMQNLIKINREFVFRTTFPLLWFSVLQCLLSAVVCYGGEASTMCTCRCCRWLAAQLFYIRLRCASRASERNTIEFHTVNLDSLMTVRYR